jgi:glucose/mannose-6-phosphate isomerase
MNPIWQEILSDPDRFNASDPQKMMARVSGFPMAFQTAWKAGAPIPSLTDPARLLTGGMGGSAIAGDLAAAMVGRSSLRPMIAVRDYCLPPTGNSDLLLLCSYSGNTEETLALFAEAKMRSLPMVVITSGGRLQELCQGEYPLIKLPGGSPPRAALPSILGSTLALLANLQGGETISAEIPQISSALEAVMADCDPLRPPGDNPAKTIAMELGENRPVCVSLAAGFESAALRLCCQFEENAKVFSMVRSLPEMHHNSWIPWLGGDPLGVPLWLGTDDAHPRVRLRMRISEQCLAEEGLPAIAIPTVGETRGARLLTNVLLGDFISVYHALMREVDPTPVDLLTTMKNRLAETVE